MDDFLVEDAEVVAPPWGSLSPSTLGWDAFGCGVVNGVGDGGNSV